MWHWTVLFVMGQTRAVLGERNGHIQLRGTAELGFILHVENISDVLKIFNILRDF